MTLLDPHHPVLDDALEVVDERATTVAELEAANAELRHVAAVIAHDLRQPLAAVTAFAHHLQEVLAPGAPAEAHRLADEIAKGCAEIDEILDAAMAYAQATGRADERTLVAAGAAADAAWWNVQATAQERGGRLTLGKLPLVSYDPIQLRQVFQNLFVNALTYVAPDVEPAIAVSATRQASGWTISVQDNGLGMAARQLDAPLRRRRSDSSDRRGGSGLGLLICKRIVERHGGRMRVAPAPGGGTVVSFDVPDGAEDLSLA